MLVIINTNDKCHGYILFNSFTLSKNAYHETPVYFIIIVDGSVGPYGL